MNKFQKLSQLNKDIELLENAGKFKAADVLHKKFIKEAQFAMPMTYNPMMFNPMMFNPMAYNPMAARTVVNPTGAVSQPAVQAPTTPVTNQQAVSVPPATTSTATTPVPASGQVNPSGIKPGTPPTNLTRNTNQQGQAGFVQDQNGKIQIFGQDGKPISYVAPPGSTVGPGLKELNPGLPPGYQPPVSQITPPTPIQQSVYDHYGGKITKIISEIDDPKKLKEFYNSIKKYLDKEKGQGRLTQEQYDELMKQMYGN